MAHYDSVDFAPGAGDDGAGVATLLEIARALHDEPKPRNSILFAFTDGEEAGLLGAEAFFSQHAWADDVAAVINIEGSGSARSFSCCCAAGPRSGAILEAFRSMAPYPVASSFSEELFKRLPNDTDLSVSNHAGKPGIDFAFAGERNHYHSRGDSIANLSLATLQHHGENALPLVRALSDADLSIDAPNYVYSTPHSIVLVCVSAADRTRHRDLHRRVARSRHVAALARPRPFLRRARHRRYSRSPRWCCWSSQRSRSSTRSPAPAFHGPPIRGRGVWSSTRFPSSALRCSGRSSGASDSGTRCWRRGGSGRW